MYDVVVVGARCAGAALAMLLARAGRRVALIDRATFPSDTMSSHFLWPRGVARLAAWGLLEELRARGCQAIPQLTLDVGPVQLHGTVPAVDGIRDSYCPRRTVLDAILVDAATAAGADLIDGFTVTGLSWTDGRAAGVVGQVRCSGQLLRVPASLVVGADGLQSTVAAAVGSATYRAYPALTCVYYSYWGGLAARPAAFHVRPDRLILTWPTNDDLMCVYVAWPVADFPTVRTDVQGAFESAVAAVPEVAALLASGRREHRFNGTRRLPNLYRASAGPGWALAGDAGHHKDPATGMGMSDAFTSAELLATAVLTAPTETVDPHLREYERRRNAVTVAGFDLTLRTARLAPLSARLEAFYRAAADQPVVIEQIFGVLGGAIPVADVYSASNLDSVIARA